MPSEQTYLFYDLETTGLSPTFDQILQFAAIRVDNQFNEIERYYFKIVLSEDVIPSPGALLVNRTAPSDFSQGMDEYTVIKRIHDIINAPGTISLGYNTLAFDEEFLRFSFFRHLLPPYTHQYANDCRRMDIYPMILLAYHLCPDLLRWPTINGKISFKLEHLARENHLSSGRSHDALIDVLDTIALAKQLKSNAAFWEQAVSCFDKKVDAALLENGQTQMNLAGKTYTTGFMIEAKPNGTIAPVLYLGESHKNHTRWLRLDNLVFESCSQDTLIQKIDVIRKKFGEPPFYFSNNHAYCASKLTDAQCTLLKNNLDFLNKNPELLASIQHYVLGMQYTDHPDYDANAALYKLPFPTSQQESLFRKFHLIEKERKLAVADQLLHLSHQEQKQEVKIALQAYYALAIRLLGRHFSSVLSDDAKANYQQYLTLVLTSDPQQALIDHAGKKKLTLPEAIEHANNLMREKTDEESKQFLFTLLTWYQRKFPVLIRQNACHPALSLFARTGLENQDQPGVDSEQKLIANG